MRSLTRRTAARQRLQGQRRFCTKVRHQVCFTIFTSVYSDFHHDIVADIVANIIVDIVLIIVIVLIFIVVTIIFAVAAPAVSMVL